MPLPEKNPWPSLVSYSEDDAWRFCGRDADIDHLLGTIQRSTLAVLYGVSGLGKTSLAMAGASPYLRRGGALPVRIRIEWEHIGVGKTYATPEAFVLVKWNKAMTAATAVPMGGDSALPAAGDTLWEAFHREGATPRVNGKASTPVLILDQFEEIFHLPSRSESALVTQFIGQLGALVTNRPPSTLLKATEAPEVKSFVFEQVPIRVLICLREDYLARFLSLRHLLPLREEQMVRLERLTHEGAKQVMYGPSGQFAHYFESGTVVNPVGESTATNGAMQAVLEVARDRQRSVFALDSGSDEVRYDPAVLSVMLSGLWKAGGGHITSELIEDRRDDILKQLYNDAFIQVESLKLGPEVELGTHVFIQEKLLDSLEGRTRLHQPKSEAVYKTDGTFKPIPHEVLRALQTGHLLTIHGDVEAPNTWLELSHDCLCDIVRQLRDDRRKLEAEDLKAKLKREQQLRADLVKAHGSLQRIRWAIIFAILLVLIGIIAVAAVSWKVKEVDKKLSNAMREKDTLEGLISTIQQDKSEVERQRNELVEQRAALENAARTEPSRQRGKSSACVRVSHSKRQRSQKT